MVGATKSHAIFAFMLIDRKREILTEDLKCRRRERHPRGKPGPQRWVV